jgi:hypothetical protein
MKYNWKLDKEVLPEGPVVICLQENMSAFRDAESLTAEVIISQFICSQAKIPEAENTGCMLTKCFHGISDLPGFPQLFVEDFHMFKAIFGCLAVIFGYHIQEFHIKL